MHDVQHLLLDLAQAPYDIFVQRDLALLLRTELIAQRQVDLATGQVPTEQLADLGLQLAEFIGQLDTGFEVAMIHRA